MNKKQGLAIIFTVLMFFLYVSFLSACGGDTEPQHTGGESSPPVKNSVYLDISLNKGKLSIAENENCTEYIVYANGEELCSTDKTEIEIARKIIEAYEYSYVSNWSIEVEGKDADGKTVISSEDAVEFAIWGLNGENFVSKLSEEYGDNDYFILEENVKLYGIDQALASQSNCPAGYQTVYLAYSAGSVYNFVKKPFTACLDGNGHTLYAKIDKRISYRQDVLMGIGGLFDRVGSVEKDSEDKITEIRTGAIKNLSVNLDYLYEQLGGWYTGPFVNQGYYGTLENVFISTVLRPVYAYRESSNQWKSGPIIYEEDERAAIIGVTNNAVFNDCVFSLKILDENNNEKIGGGAIGYIASENAVFNNCVYIQNCASPAFANPLWKFDTAADVKTNGLYFNKSILDFINGINCYKFVDKNGDFTEIPYNRDCNRAATLSQSGFTPVNGTVYGGFGSEWQIAGGEIKLLGEIVFSK